MSECPTCGDSFKSENGVKTHHKQIHGESIRGVVLTCHECDNKYTRSKSHAKNSKFCSRECQSKHGSSGHSTLTCNFCGDEYNIPQRISDESKFCSNDCQNNYRRKLESDPRSSSKWREFSSRYREWVGFCENCKSDNNLHVHHDQPLSKDGHLWKNTFTVLCQDCHLGEFEKWH